MAEIFFLGRLENAKRALGAANCKKMSGEEQRTDDTINAKKARKRSNNDKASNEAAQKKPKRKRRTREEILNDRPVWSLEERCRLVEAIESKFGNFNTLKAKHVGTKLVCHVETYSKFYNLLETGVKFPEFIENAAIDAWIDLAEKTTKPGDKHAEQCIPQIMTVAALEPRTSQQTGKNVNPEEQPNYANVYNYIAIILRGGDPPDLPPIDAQVTIALLDGLVERFAQSYTTLQREFLHDAYSVLSGRDTSPTNVIDFDKEKQKEKPQDNQAMAGSSRNTISNKGQNAAPHDNQPIAGTSRNLYYEEEETDTPQENQQIPDFVPPTKKFSSLNPLNVPAVLLDFKKKKPIALDFKTTWRTKIL